MADPDEQERKKFESSTKFMEESYDLVNQQRHGLFSQPGGLAIGENTYHVTKKPKKDEDGRVATEPPNFLTTKTKKGTTDQVLFSSPTYISQGDPYTDKKLTMRESAKDGYKKVADLPFKPAKTVPRSMQLEHEWVGEPDDKKKTYRDADGAVITAPKNFVTTGAKKGIPGSSPGTLFQSEFYEHMKDEYDMKKDLAKKELEESKKKMQEKPFSQRIKPQSTFANVEQTYGEEGMTFKPKKPPAKAKPQVDHDKPFRPSNPPKKGLVDKSIAPFPEYVEDNKGKPKPKRQVKKDDERPAWKPNYSKKTIPSPSVATNMKNIRSALPAMMRR